MENRKENKKGKMTLDKLARMVGDGFNEATEKTNRIENKLSEHDKRFDTLEFKVDEVKDTIERLEESDILNLQKRVQVLEKAVRTLAATNQTSK